MAWFGGADPVAELDAKIEEATSEAIPNGELDVATALEITDEIRSKKVQPKQAMRCLKKRLTKVYMNPNLLSSTLKLCDMCVKNGGSHFLVELNSKEFMAYLVDVIFKVHYDTKNYKVYTNEAKLKAGEQILILIQEWAAYFNSSGKDSFLDRVLSTLKSQGYEFPPLDPLISSVASNFVDSEAPPDWIDGKECMICYNSFSVMNRQHHCRACGGVFCQNHSSNSIPLVSLGILLPVRVCDDCYQIHKNGPSTKTKNAPTEPTKATKHSRRNDDEEDDELKRAIELSLKETLFQASYVPPPETLSVAPPSATNDSDLDDDIKAAIKASLEDQKELGLRAQIVPPVVDTEELELDFYSNLIPFDANAYSQQPLPTDTRLEFGIPSFQSQPVDNYQRPSIQEPETVKPRQELLTEQDEENVNLFVQLMHGIKNDRFKQANILNDQDLNDLHGKVVRLKPKLNRALRDAIEKYEVFLEMNNKINSITRLYDQYLENMLSTAYNKHSIYQTNDYYNGPYPASQDNILSQPQNSSLPDVGLNPNHARQQSYFDNQPTGSQKPYWNLPEQYGQYLPNQTKSYGQVDEPKLKPFVATGSALQTPYSVSEISPSEITSASQNRQRSDSMYPVNSGVFPVIPSPTFDKPEQKVASQFTGSYPQEPSSPPDDSDLDDAESVSSRFPPVESLYEPEVVENDAQNVQPASMRFPSLSKIELPNDIAESATSSSEPKFKAEPEPLIEL